MEKFGEQIQQTLCDPLPRNNVEIDGTQNRILHQDIYSHIPIPVPKKVAIDHDQTVLYTDHQRLQLYYANAPDLYPPQYFKLNT